MATTYYYGKDRAGNPVYESSQPGTKATSTKPSGTVVNAPYSTSPTQSTATDQSGKPIATPSTPLPTLPKAPLGVDQAPTAPQAPVAPTAPVAAPGIQDTQANMLAAGAASGDATRQAAAALGSAPIASPYQAAKNALAGTPVAQDRGAAMGEMTRALDQNRNTQQDTSAVDSFISTVPGVSDLMSSMTELLNPVNQTTTLLQDYQSLYKESGLDKINQEIIDADTIINGTEDDIRNEVQAAGGFGTDSQVQAMALSRNKGLLKRYNQLVQMKTDATNQLNTLSQLNYQDKQMAQQRLNTQIDSMFKIADFNQKAQNNVREQARWLTEQMGADGVYNAYKQDPRQLGFLEKSLGLAPGGMQSLATQAATERATKAQKGALELETLRSGLLTDQAQRSKIAAEITKLKSESTSGDAKVAARTVERVNKAEGVIAKIGEAGKLINNISTGTSGGLFRMLPGTQAYTLDKTLTTIKANLGFDELQKMRENSPTGGALGQVAVQELEALQSTVASLDTGLPADTLRSNLEQIQGHYKTWLNTVGYELTPDGQVIEITD